MYAEIESNMLQMLREVSKWECAVCGKSADVIKV